MERQFRSGEACGADELHDRKAGPTSSLVDGLLNTRVWPTLIANAGGRVLAANRLATELFNADGDWTLCAGVISHRDEATKLSLHTQIRMLAERSDPGPARSAFFVDASDGAQTLVSMARIDDYAVQRGVSGPNAPLAVLITFNDGRRRQVDQSCKLLFMAFDFTPAEARLTFALLDGQTLQHFSDLAGVRISTTRWHLRNALAKTGCSNQRDLVRLVISLLDS